MSYYIAYQEISEELLQELLSQLDDTEFQYKRLERFYEDQKNNQDKLFRRLFLGNQMLAHNEEELAHFGKTRSFNKLLNSYKQKYPIHKEVRIANGEIESYVQQEELKDIWQAINELITCHPEYKVEPNFNKQEVFSDYPSTWDDVVRFYYSCWLNKSVAIKIVG